MLSASQSTTCTFLIGTNSRFADRSFEGQRFATPPTYKKLEISLTLPKSTTSDFLIDNFCTLSASCPSPASSLERPASSNSNRHIPELESSLSYRKQSTENFLIAKFRPMHRKLGQCGASSTRSRLLTLDSRLPPLIANETHSRKASSACEQSTYQILIANEFHHWHSSKITARQRAYRMTPEVINSGLSAGMALRNPHFAARGASLG